MLSKEQILESVGRWRRYVEILEDIVSSLSDKVEISDVWNACISKYGNDECVGALVILSNVVRDRVKSVDVFNCVGRCDEEEFMIMGKLFELVADGYKRMVLEGLVSLVARSGVDVGKWLDWCVRVFDPTECVYTVESITALREIKSELDELRGGVSVGHG